MRKNVKCPYFYRRIYGAQKSGGEFGYRMQLGLDIGLRETREMFIGNADSVSIFCCDYEARINAFRCNATRREAVVEISLKACGLYASRLFDLDVMSYGLHEKTRRHEPTANDVDEKRRSNLLQQHRRVFV